MLFPTFAFGIFFLALFAMVWSLGRHNEWRKIVLLVASWIFYGAWDWRFVLLLIGSSLLNFSCAALVERTAGARSRRAMIALGVACNLGILCVFKYYGFFVEQAHALIARFHLPLDPPFLQIILPIGVSFFTFQGISYIVDVHRGRIRAASLLDVTLLLSFFAHLVAGPIVRGADLLPQFGATPRLDREEAARGLLLIVWGLFKKTVIATELATHLVDPVFQDASLYGPADLLCAMWGYAVQIYCDFSAYSDMAIGLAALLGYRFPANFDRPYRSASLREFWQRWHISLSSWLRDYLYIPLGGSRGGLVATCRNLFATMVLGGLWHGASWNFVIWGALHGAVLCAERIGMSLRLAPRLPAWLGVIVTFHIVCLGWIFFRAADFGVALGFLRGFAGDWSRGPAAASPLCLGLIVLGLATQALPAGSLEGTARRLARWPAVGAAAAIAASILVIDAMRPAGVPPFIYFQF
jgi:D-alanyl-lipoteichoic acid acyltransferase DltB (MBOAT superfamily)